MPAKKSSGSGGEAIKKQMRIRNPQGLHARPAAVFAQVATRFKSSVKVRKGKRTVDGKSIMGLLTLAAERGSTVEISVEGPDAADALSALEQLLSHSTLPDVVTVIRHHRAGA